MRRLCLNHNSNVEVAQEMLVDVCVCSYAVSQRSKKVVCDLDCWVHAGDVLGAVVGFEPGSHGLLYASGYGCVYVYVYGCMCASMVCR